MNKPKPTPTREEWGKKSIKFHQFWQTLVFRDEMVIGKEVPIGEGKTMEIKSILPMAKEAIEDLLTKTSTEARAEALMEAKAMALDVDIEPVIAEILDSMGVENANKGIAEEL